MEIWKPIKQWPLYAYDGGWKYEVSNLGQVRKAGYRGYKKYYEPRVLKQAMDKNGRMKVKLCEGGKCYTCHVSRLVALAFLKRVPGADQVIHKNGNIQDNSASNLMWARSTRSSPYVKSLAKPVRQYALDGEFLAEYKSATVVQLVLGYDHSVISSCCRRVPKHHTGYGYIWRFPDDDEYAEVQSADF